MNPSDLQALRQARVLIVEDNAIIRTQVEQIIMSRVDKVYSAEDGEAGLAIWRTEQPDVVITDIEMPIMDGLTMCEQIQKLDPDAEIIVMSMSSAIAHLSRAIEIGVNRYIFKPIDTSLLLDALTKSYRDRKRTIELRLSRMVFEVANEGILITDQNSHILAVNPAFSEITGYRPDEVIGKHARLLSSGLHNNDFYQSMWSTIGTHGRWSGEVTNRKKNGEVYTQWLSIAAISNQMGLTANFVGLIADISERKKEEELIRKLAHFDSLTGLPNRALFQDRLQRAIAAATRTHKSLALLYIDLDLFKAINDEHGHAAGDHVLRTSAERMRASVRQTDVVSRQGGDEFVIMLDAIDGPDAAVLVCNKLLESLAQPIPYENKKLQISASIGASIFPDDSEDMEALFNAADFALYEAKGAGRNRFSFFSPETMAAANIKLDMEHELREGMLNWRYTLHYLPEVSLSTGKIEKIEALLRFNHPTFGLLDAGRFLELAEEIGIMPELGQRALAQAATEALQLSEKNVGVGLVVDLSPRQLSANGSAESLLAEIQKSGLAADKVTFECPERALTGNEQAMRTLYTLADSGCAFTLDDFGVGYCSFSLISQLPMTAIKIDRSFVSQIEFSNQYRELVAALIAFSKRLGLRTIAEGVETPVQLAFLKEAGCDAAQGYLFGRPMDYESIEHAFTSPDWAARLTKHQDS